MTDTDNTNGTDGDLRRPLLDENAEPQIVGDDEISRTVHIRADAKAVFAAMTPGGRRAKYREEAEFVFARHPIMQKLVFPPEGETDLVIERGEPEAKIVEEPRDR